MHANTVAKVFTQTAKIEEVRNVYTTQSITPFLLISNPPCTALAPHQIVVTKSVAEAKVSGLSHREELLS